MINPFLSYFCRQLTHIEQEYINRASAFPDVADEFQEWSGVFDDEDYLLCSWGSFDKKLLVQDCILHKLDYDWTAHHINLKRQYQELKRLHRSRGLKAAVNSEGFEFTGSHHRGIDDAKNLAKIFVKYLDEWKY